jgi:hypothetical protein
MNRPKDIIDYIEALAAASDHFEPVDEGYYQSFPRTHAAANRKARRGRRDAAFLQNNLVDPARRHAQRPRQRVLRKAVRRHKLLAENFARMNRSQFFDPCLHAFTNVFAQ